MRGEKKDVARKYRVVNEDCAKLRVQLDALARLASQDFINDHKVMKEACRRMRKGEKIEKEYEEDVSRVLSVNSRNHAPTNGIASAVTKLEKQFEATLVKIAAHKGASVNRLKKSRKEDYGEGVGGIRKFMEREEVPIITLPNSKSLKNAVDFWDRPLFVIDRSMIKMATHASTEEVLRFFGAQIVQPRTAGDYRGDIVDDRSMPIQKLEVALHYVLYKWIGDLEHGSIAASLGVCLSDDMQGNPASESKSWRFICENAGTYAGKGGFVLYYDKTVREGHVPWFDRRKHPIPVGSIQDWLSYHDTDPESRKAILARLLKAGVEPNPGPPKQRRDYGKKGDAKQVIEDGKFKACIEKAQPDVLLQMSTEMRPGKQREMVLEKLSQILNSAEAKSEASMGERQDASSFTPTTSADSEEPPPPPPSLIKNPPSFIPVTQSVSSISFNQDDQLLPKRHVTAGRWGPFLYTRCAHRCKLVRRITVTITASQGQPQITDNRTAAERIVDLKAYSQTGRVHVKTEFYFPVVADYYMHENTHQYFSVLAALSKIGVCVAGFAHLFGLSESKPRLACLGAVALALSWASSKIHTYTVRSLIKGRVDHADENFDTNVMLAREGCPRLAELTQATVNQTNAAVSRTFHVNRLGPGLGDETPAASKLGYYVNCASQQEVIDVPTQPLHFRQPTM